MHVYSEINYNSFQRPTGSLCFSVQGSAHKLVLRDEISVGQNFDFTLLFTFPSGTCSCKQVSIWNQEHISCQKYVVLGMVIFVLAVVLSISLLHWEDSPHLNFQTPYTVDLTIGLTQPRTFRNWPAFLNVSLY